MAMCSNYLKKNLLENLHCMFVLMEGGNPEDSAHLSRSLTNPLWVHLRVLHGTHLALAYGLA